MSYSYQVSERRRRTTQNGGYGASGNRSTFGYWIPLAITLTAATVGLAAWMWSERKEDEEDSSSDERVYEKTNTNNNAIAGPRPPPPPGYGDNAMSGGVGPLPPTTATGTGPAAFQGPPGSMSGPPVQGSFQELPPSGPGATTRNVQGGKGSAFRSTDVGGEQDNTGFVARVSSALGIRTAPSPAQAYEWGSKTISAGVAAAGAAVGGALASVREGGYEDHDRWSEEAEKRDGDKEITMGIKRSGTAEEFFSGSVELPKGTSLSQKRRKTVAIVVSAVETTPGISDEEEVGHHASILSHLPDFVNLDNTRVFVLIYAPYLRTIAGSRLVDVPENYPQPLRGGSIFAPREPSSTTVDASKQGRPSQSMASSFSNISHADAHTPAHTPGEYPDDERTLADVEPRPLGDEATTLYKTLYTQALMLVENETLILPYTSQHGHRHLLKSLTPETIYIQESLCGVEGDIVSDLSGWIRQTVVVIGDEGGHGGLIDTDDEAVGSMSRKGSLWWQKEERTGLGKRVAIVESLKIGEDWSRRINEKE